MKFRSQNILFLVSCLLIYSCVSDKAESVSINDATLFELAKTQTGFQYFKRSTDTLLSDPSSPHGSYVRIRFNEMAVTGMNNDLSNLSASKFPDGSMIVKEIYSTPGGNLAMYAAMYKSSVDHNTGGGWIWAEYEWDGDVVYSTARKGADCTACHSAAGNADFIRTFSLH